MTDAVSDMLSAAPAGPEPPPADGDAKYKDDPVYQMLSGAGPSDAGAPAPAPGPAAPGPAAPAAAPPRPRATARLPAPAPKPPGAPPGAIVNAQEDLSPLAVLGGAAANFIPSSFNQLTQMARPLFDWKGDAAFAHTLHTNPGAVWKAVQDVYGPRYDLLHPYREGGILQTLKHDPDAPLTDLAAVGSILGGGELLAPKLAGTAGDVVNIASKVGKASQYLDPAYAAAKAVSAPVGAALRNPGVARGIGSALGKAGGAAAGLAIPATGAHLVTGLVGEHIGGELGSLVGRGLSKVAQNPVVRRVTRTAEGMIPAASVASGLMPDQGQPAGQGAAPGAGPASGGPQLDPRYADDPVYAMLMGGGSPGPAPGGPGSAAGGGDPGNVADVIRQAEGGFNQPVGYRVGPGVSARGAYQMIDSTYRTNLRKYHPEIARGMTDGQIDAFRNSESGWGLNESMGRQMVGDEMAQLQQEGIAPTADNVGALHMLGNTRLLHADPNTPIEQVTTPGQRSANAGIFRNIRTAGDYLAWMRRRNATASAQLRPAHAAGGQVIDLTEKLLQRAGRAQKDAQSATKPLLGLSDDTVAQALRVAQRGL